MFETMCFCRRGESALVKACRNMVVACCAAHVTQAMLSTTDETNIEASMQLLEKNTANETRIEIAKHAGVHA